MKVNVELYCMFCGESLDASVELPDGWNAYYDSIISEDWLCPDHSKIKEWADEQCPGCVGSFGNCGLFDSFAYSSRVTITERDLNIIKQGICPFRVNGSFTTVLTDTGSGISVELEETDLSEIATAGGKELAQAIVEYTERYGGK